MVWRGVKEALLVYMKILSQQFSGGFDKIRENLLLEWPNTGLNRIRISEEHCSPYTDVSLQSGQ
jgi:hypothetical protein